MDHTHPDATQNAAGFLSAEDKIQLDYGGIPIVTAYSEDGANYTATVDGVTALTIGTKITILPQVVSTATQPKLNVNELGAKAICISTGYNSSDTTTATVVNWMAVNKPVTVQYNGTYWVTTDLIYPSANNLSGTLPVAHGGVPAATTNNNGQFLRVVNGIPTWATVENVEEVSF